MYGLCLPWLWQKISLLLNSLLEFFLLWLLEFYWFFIVSLLYICSPQSFLKWRYFLTFSHILFKSSFTPFTSWWVSPISWHWPPSISRWILNFHLQLRPLTPSSEPYVQPPTGHLYLNASQGLQIQCTYTFTHCLPPKTYLSCIADNAPSLSYSCIEVWPSHIFHGLCST